MSAPRPPFWRLHFSTCVATAVFATGSFALDIPNTLFGGRPHTPDPIANFSVTVVVSLIVMTVTESLAREHHRTQKSFQIRLVTAVVALLLASGLLYLNISPWKTDLLFGSFREQRGGQAYEVWGKVNSYGWPMRAYRDFSPTIAYNPERKVEASFVATENYFNSSNSQFSSASIVFNAIFCFAVLYEGICISEYLIRRREARKP